MKSVFFLFFLFEKHKKSNDKHKKRNFPFLFLIYFIQFSYVNHENFNLKKWKKITNVT